MKTRLAVGLVIVGMLSLPQFAEARAETCHLVRTTAIVRDTVVVRTKRVCTAVMSSGVAVVPTDGSATDAACAGAAAAMHVPASKACPTTPKKPGEPGPGLIAAAVWRLRLPASGFHIQPVKGRTLVNLRTNFYATNSPIERTITLLGRRIGVRVWASSYAWAFGDGSRRSTASPGAPYPNLLVTHRYLHKGTVRPSLSTIYAAEYRIGQRAWRPVPGSASIASPTQRLEVVTATPRLTNPYG